MKPETLRPTQWLRPHELDIDGLPDKPWELFNEEYMADINQGRNDNCWYVYSCLIG